MRLLNVETFQFDDFFYQTPPRYAILSHTWGKDSDEVSYSNVLAGRLDSPETRPAKVSGCCDQARKDGYKYIWIDTCCIDKTNSVELQEAINSMFKWYREAAICYVYLADLPPGDEIHNPDSRFRSSRWFQRGWTLQELLAPLHVRFYNANWQCLGTKGELCEVIEDITGIPSLYLLGIHELHHASIAQRMSWAASRVTKREEDIAYCLLGIFDIVMSMIYGEGPNAFRRLQEQIMLKHPSDDSILAWGLHPRTPPSFSSPLAIHPSQFALSGQIVSRLQSGTDSIDLRAGTVRLHLRIFPTPGTDQTFGALRCGPEHDPEMFVCLPLTRASEDEDGVYTRIRENCAVLEKITDSGSAVPCRIRVDGKLRQSTELTQAHFFHIQRSPSVLCLEIVDVQPPERWHKERSLIEAPAPNGDGQHCAFVRLRDDNLDSDDFVLVLEAVADGPTLRAQCDLMTASKDTPLSEIQSMLKAIRSRQPLRLVATNDVLTLRAILKSEPRGRTFSLRLEKLSHRAELTTNAAFELEYLGMSKEIRCLRKARQAVIVEDEALIHAIQPERMALKEVEVELLGVEEELRKILERKARLDGSKAAHSLKLDNLLEKHHEKDSKLKTLDSWVKTASEQLESFANNAPLDSNGEQKLVGPRLLYLAAAKGYDDLLRALLKKRAPIEETEELERTPLHAAAEGGYTKAVQLLLDNGASLDAKADNNSTPLHLAVENGHDSTVGLLLERGAKMTPDSCGWVPLHMAAQHGSESITRRLLERGADVAVRNDRGSTPLHIAANHGHLAVAQLLLTSGADVDSDIQGMGGSRPLHYAAMNGHEKVADLLLDRGASISAVCHNKSNWTALRLALENGHENVARLLLDRGASISATYSGLKRTALHAASLKGHENVVRLLLDRGASISDCLAVSNNETVLHVASHCGHENVVRLLLERGADPNVRCRDGWTPLHSAAVGGSESVMKLLIDYGARVEAEGSGVSVLALAVKRGHEDAVRFLISEGADVSHKRVVEYAKREGNEAMARILSGDQANVRNSPPPDALKETVAASLEPTNTTTVYSFAMDFGKYIFGRRDDGG
ncbi:ankyrin repeat-containing domain protein [Podospora conica]|nr:ankyrin repeat-containing domain protein [Schizothecium conicum]